MRGSGALRTLRIPAALGIPQPVLSKGLAGWTEGPEGSYAHLTGPHAWLHNAESPATDTPSLYEANARIVHWSMQPQGGEFQLQGHVALEFSLRMRPECQVRVQQRSLSPQPTRNPARTNVRYYRLNDVTARIQILCPAP